MDSQFPADISRRIEGCGVIAVLVIDDASHAVPLANALLSGGVDCMELTLRTPAAIDALRAVRREVPQMLAGIGTILSPEQVGAVASAGAAFGVAPGLNSRVVKNAQQHKLPFAPGVVTPSDVEAAIELGCRDLKFFPAEPSGGMPYLRSINAPYAHLNLRYIPLGGINAQNMTEYLADPAVPAVGGSWLAPRKLIAAQDWAAITANANAARQAIIETRAKIEMTRIVTFGEIMGRLTPPGFVRLRQGLPGTLDVSFAGAEANVAASLSLLGADALFVTALPNNELADACIASLQSTGMASHIIRTEYGRLGLYFLETGANQRPSRVIYDRENSAISLTEPAAYDWQAIFDSAAWFHVTGITPALSQEAADATIDSVQQAKSAGLTVSCDLNFRGKLWRWDDSVSQRELAGRVMREVLPHVDVLIANEEDCTDVLGIRAAQSDAQSGQLQVDRYPDVARQVVAQFPNVNLVATTLRQSISASHNNWGAMLYDAKADMPYFAPQNNGAYQPYEIRNIVDRVGGGDSFAAGLIFALTCDDYAGPQAALDFAVAASCLAHSIRGDINFCSRDEVDALASGSSSGRVVR